MILSLENHLCKDQQARLAELLQLHLGPWLLTQEDLSSLDEPTLASLERRVLLKAKLIQKIQKRVRRSCSVRQSEVNPPSPASDRDSRDTRRETCRDTCRSIPEKLEQGKAQATKQMLPGSLELEQGKAQATKQTLPESLIRRLSHGKDVAISTWRHGEELALSTLRHGEEIAMSTVRHGEEVAMSTVRHGEDLALSTLKHGKEVAIRQGEAMLTDLAALGKTHVPKEVPEAATVRQADSNHSAALASAHMASMLELLADTFRADKAHHDAVGQ